MVGAIPDKATRRLGSDEKCSMRIFTAALFMGAPSTMMCIVIPSDRRFHFTQITTFHIPTPRDIDHKMKLSYRKESVRNRHPPSAHIVGMLSSESRRAPSNPYASRESGHDSIGYRSYAVPSLVCSLRSQYCAEFYKDFAQTYMVVLLSVFFFGFGPIRVIYY